MPSNTSSKSSIKTRESKTSNSSSKGSSHSSKKPEQKEPSKVTSSSKSKPEQKESTKVKSRAGSVTKSSTSSKNVKNDLVNKNSVNVSKSRSSSLSNKSSKISSSSNASSEKKSSSTSKSSPRKSTLESSGGRKHESLRRKEQRSSNKDEDSKSEEKKKLSPSKESREKGSKSAKEASKTSSKSGSHSPRKSSKDDSKNKKHEEKIKTEKESKAKKIDEKTKKTKAENVDKNKTEKIEKIKPKKSEKSKPEKIEKIKSEKIEKTKAEKSAKTNPEKIEEAKSEKIEETKTEKTAKTKEEKIEEAKPEKIEKTEEREKFINNEYSSVKEKGEIDRMEKPIVMENDKEIIGRDVPEVITTTVNPNDNSLETLESGISITTPNELSDGEVEESISSRFVEVDEMEYPSPPSSSINLHSSSQNPRNDSKLEEEEEEEEEEKGIKEDNMYMDYEEDFENYESDFEDEDVDEDDDEDDDDDDESIDNDDEEEDEDGDEDEDEDDDDDSDENIDVDKDSEDLDKPDPQMVAVLMALEVENRRPKTRASQNASGVTNNQEIETSQETSSTTSSRNRPKTSRAYVNFNRAKERAKGEKASEKMKNRGQILLEMIQLDTISIDLFIQVSDSYESYIAAFGTTNTLQTSTQTNDDAISEEVQTESPPLLNKWTQKPINISVKDDYLPTAEDFLGVGGDSAQDDDEENTHATFKSLSVDSEHLTKFLSASTQVVLMLLEEDSVFKNDSLGSDDDEDLGFSKTGIVLGNGMNSLLKGRKATFVSFCSSDPLMIVTGHDFQDLNNNATGFISKENRKNSESEVENEEGLETQNEEQKSEEEPSNESFSENGAFLCIWSIRQPSFPQRILCCHSSPKVACFSPGRPIALVAGLTDGSLAAWDFRESLANHPVTVSFGDDKKWRLSPPSYITACHKEGFIGGSEIVAIEAVGKPEEHSSNFGSFQVVSLSASGQLTWWVIVQGEIQPMKMTDLNSTGILTEHGAAPWSRIIISRAASLSVEDMLPQSEDDFPGSNLCYDLKLSSSDSNQIYVAIANGRVLHCSRHSIKLHPSSFIPEIEPGAEAISISVCPHDPLYLLVGGNDGLIRLHSITSPSPLTCWQASNNPAPVRKVEWSPSRPCVFYMLDNLGMFHIWDLSAGDIYPIVSVEKGEIVDGDLTDFNVASSSTDLNQPLHAVFASESGTVSIRTISSLFLKSSEEEYKNELERFRCYVSII
ncbi:UNVERIFIED_CONTAM: hypothetical protein RMT77_004629 [Armadillidium vulgare]